VDCLPDFRAVGACKLISKTVVGKIQMRRYAYLKEPIKTNKKDSIYKIMLYQTKKDGV